MSKAVKTERPLESTPQRTGMLVWLRSTLADEVAGMVHCEMIVSSADQLERTAPWIIRCATEWAWHGKSCGYHTESVAWRAEY